MTVSSLSGSSTTQLNSVGGGVLHILAIVGSGLSIIFLICLGIKYMLGSIEEKAEYKKTMLPYLVGAIFVFGASSIAGVVYNMFK